MNELPRQKLVELIGRYGVDLARDARRCEALLRDVCPQHKREIFVLVSAAKESVGIDLLGSSSGMPKDALLSRLSKRVHENLGVTEDLARWAVESWALALGILSSEDFRSSSECPGSAATPRVRVSSDDDDLFSEFPQVSVEDLLRQTIRGVLADGIVTDDERAEVHKLRTSLGIAPDVAARILAEVKAELRLGPVTLLQSQPVPQDDVESTNATGATPPTEPARGPESTWIHFSSAQILASSLRLPDRQAWNTYCASGSKPNNVPADPDAVYRGRGWVSWEHWLDTGKVNVEATDAVGDSERQGVLAKTLLQLVVLFVVVSLYWTNYSWKWLFILIPGIVVASWLRTFWPR